MSRERAIRRTRRLRALAARDEGPEGQAAAKQARKIARRWGLSESELKEKEPPKFVRLELGNWTDDAGKPDLPPWAPLLANAVAQLHDGMGSYTEATVYVTALEPNARAAVQLFRHVLKILEDLARYEFGDKPPSSALFRRYMLSFVCGASAKLHELILQEARERVIEQYQETVQAQGEAPATAELARRREHADQVQAWAKQNGQVIDAPDPSDALELLDPEYVRRGMNAAMTAPRVWRTRRFWGE